VGLLASSLMTSLQHWHGIDGRKSANVFMITWLLCGRALVQTQGGPILDLPTFSTPTLLITAQKSPPDE
jgi:hypothetical protein